MNNIATPMQKMNEYNKITKVYSNMIPKIGFMKI